MDDGPHNAARFLRNAAEKTPGRAALIFPGEDGRENRIQFLEIWERICRLAEGLSQAGLAPGSRAILMIPMSADLYVSLLAILKIGAVAVFLDPWVKPSQIAAFAEFAEPSAFLGVPKSHLLRFLKGSLRRIPLTATTGSRFWRLPALKTMRELEAFSGSGELFPVKDSDPALITFTTGSSGKPKGANRTHGFLAAQHLALASEFPYRDDDVDMPMFPVFALNNLALGITSVIPSMDFRRVDQVDASSILRQMRACGTTTSTASPPFFDRIAETVLSGREPDPRLRRILTGGAPVSDRQLLRWSKAFPETEILIVYGSTEAEPVAHIHSSERLQASSSYYPDRPGFCMGNFSSKVRARVVRIEKGTALLDGKDLASWDVSQGEIGELLVAGEHVCRDYYRNPEAVRENKVVCPDGTVWHRMGDTGYLDDSRRFWLVGRVHSTICRNGEWIHPQLLEEAACQADSSIRRAAAIGIPDTEFGERVALILETENPDAKELVRRRMESLGFPTDLIDSRSRPLPLDPRHNAKIDYSALRRELGGGG